MYIWTLDTELLLWMLEKEKCSLHRRNAMPAGEGEKKIDEEEKFKLEAKSLFDRPVFYLGSHP